MGWLTSSELNFSLIKVSKGEVSCDAVKIVINIIRGAGSYNGLADRHHHNPTTGCCRSGRHFVGLVILLCSAGNTLLYEEYTAAWLWAGNTLVLYSSMWLVLWPCAAWLHSWYCDAPPPDSIWWKTASQISSTPLLMHVYHLSHKHTHLHPR